MYLCTYACTSILFCLEILTHNYCKKKVEIRGGSSPNVFYRHAKTNERGQTFRVPQQTNRGKNLRRGQTKATWAPLDKKYVRSPAHRPSHQGPSLRTGVLVICNFSFSDGCLWGVRCCVWVLGFASVGGWVVGCSAYYGSRVDSLCELLFQEGRAVWNIEVDIVCLLVF